MDAETICLQNGRISLFDWQALNYQNDWSFGIASEGEPRRYYFMTVHSDGSFSIKEQTLNLFEQSEYDDCVAIFEDEKRSSEQVRGIIRDGNGKINVIRDTGWYTIPQIEQIQEELSAGNTYLRSNAFYIFMFNVVHNFTYKLCQIRIHMLNVYYQGLIFTEC